MFSSPQNVFFIIKYEFARQQQLPLSGVILVADCIATQLYKSGRQSSSSYKRTKICIEGLYAQGMEISKEGKTANAQEIPVLIKAPPLTIHAFDRSSLKFNDFPYAKKCHIFNELISTDYQSREVMPLWSDFRRIRLNYVANIFLDLQKLESRDGKHVNAVITDPEDGGLTMYCSAVQR